MVADKMQRIHSLFVWALVFILIILGVILIAGGGPEKARDVLMRGITLLSAYVYAYATDRPVEGMVSAPGEEIPGFLYIEAPQVYTRERLVNDRFQQANWLNAELAQSAEIDDWKRFVIPTRSETSDRSTDMRVSATLQKWASEFFAGPAQSSDPESTSSDGSDEGNLRSANIRPDSDQIMPDPTTLFKMRQNYRTILGNALMDAQLDDAHDQDGNTLYRLNFDAVAIPWAESVRHPGTAVYLVTAKKTDHSNYRENRLFMSNEDLIDNETMLVDRIELLDALRNELEIFFNNLIDIERFSAFEQIPLGGGTDPDRADQLAGFLKNRLVDRFFEYLDAQTRIEQDEKDSVNRTKERNANEARYEILNRREKWLEKWTKHTGLVYNYVSQQYEIESSVSASGLARFILRAEDVNHARMGHLDEKCMQQNISPNDWLKIDELNLKIYEKYHQNDNNLGKTVSDGASTAPSGMAIIHNMLKEKMLVNCVVRGSRDVNPVRGMATLIHVFEKMTDIVEEGRIKGKLKKLDHNIQKTDEQIYAGASERIRRVFYDGANLTRLKYASTARALGLPYMEQPADCRQRLKDSVNVWLESSIDEYMKCEVTNGKVSRTLENLLAEFVNDRINGSEKESGSLPHIKDFFKVRVADCIMYACSIRLAINESVFHRDFSEWSNGLLGNDSDPQRIYMGANVDSRRKCIEWIHALKTKGYVFETATWKGEIKGEEEGKAYLACILAAFLERRRESLVVYGVSPRTEGQLVRSDARTGWQVETGVAAGTSVDMILTRRFDKSANDVAVLPSVVGFSQISNMCGINTEGDADNDKKTNKEASVAGNISDKGKDEAHLDRLSCEGDHKALFRDRTTFGWVVRPVRAPDGMWAPSHHRVTAVLSAPSWWKRLDFYVKACWVNPVEMRSLGNTVLRDPMSVCPAQSSYVREFRIQLPRRVEEVTERFNFDFIKAPYLDQIWLQSVQSGKVPELEVGRSGRLVLPGARLWRGTVVTLGGQTAKRIMVLPNMKGVIAEFDCIYPPPGKPFVEIPRIFKDSAGLGTDNQSEAKPKEKAAVPNTQSGPAAMDVQVWTSEGHTKPLTIHLKPFVKRSADDRPCFVKPPDGELRRAGDGGEQSFEHVAQ